MVETPDTSTDDGAADLALDPVALGRAVQRAALDLQRIVVLLAQRYLGLRRGVVGHRAPPPTWRLLLDIEEQAFADLGFQGRHPAAVRDGFARLADSRLAGPDLDAPADWQRDDDPLPAVYAIVRRLVQDLCTDTTGVDY
ncbi:hypothetical protein BGV68_01385 [Burkholderia ubonensis]|uniref:DUF2471 family protein n=1 Tax=Burkholderia ubonensis TaxID=101571 RepID=UPI0008FD9AAA|nr:DUF2471 family protein [Burkholderia ubonensis]OJA64489.1 hypothetical protein BGV68_01385 [Burkholderia ubonensis]